MIYLLAFAVTFSRIDPGGKLVMGFRKSSNSLDTPVGHKIFHFTVYGLFFELHILIFCCL